MAPTHSPTTKNKEDGMATTIATRRGGKVVQRVLDARRDTLDFRDRMFEPTLVEVPTHIPLAAYQKLRIPVLDQGEEGACSGFGLATVANYLLTRRKVEPDPAPVSPRMLYEMARRYDEWPGEDYSGSSARGAMKGWHKHGVCSEQEWLYKVADKPAPGGLNDARTADALRRPLGAYLRVNHQDLVAMHSALAEVGILYATANVHEGWGTVTADGDIPYPAKATGAHAFAIVAYDAEGFWIQNSWSDTWGKQGFARISYDDWLANATDVWVARLGAPVTLRLSESSAIAHAPTSGRSMAYAYADLRPHIVSLGNDGQLRANGDYGTSTGDVSEIFQQDLPRAMKAWPVKRVLLYAHGGLVSERTAIQRLADWRGTMLDAQIYPISFVWHTDYWTTVTNILQDALRRRRPEGVLTDAKDFLLDRLDDTLELLARGLTGKASWDEMKENALAASKAGGGARIAVQELASLHRRMPLEVHLVGHSAGSVFLSPMLGLLKDAGLAVKTCTLWAPAITMELFKKTYLPAVGNGLIEQFALYALSDKAEQDDHVARVYNKSLLYLVSRALELRAFGKGTPLAGMEKWIAADENVRTLFMNGKAQLVFSPNSVPAGEVGASRSVGHGDFDDDEATVKGTIARIVGASVVPVQSAPIAFHRSSSSLRSRRESLDRQQSS